MTIDEMIAVLQAAKAGKKIECRAKSLNVPPNDQWYSMGPCWNFAACDYRVKPAEPREWTISACTLDRCDQAYPRRMDDIIKVREVLE